MTLAFYLDEDAMRNSLRRALRSRGIDVTSTFEAGMLRRSDEEQLNAATREGRVLYSFNIAHFCRIHADWLSCNNSNAGIVLAHQQALSSGYAATRSTAACGAARPPGIRDRLEFLSDWI